MNLLRFKRTQSSSRYGKIDKSLAGVFLKIRCLVVGWKMSQRFQPNYSPWNGSCQSGEAYLSMFLHINPSLSALHDARQTDRSKAATYAHSPQMHALHGNKWTFTASHLAGRTDNQVKNRWHAHLKKLTDAEKVRRSGTICFGG